jgi:DNA-binding MarR family transcriptional regulator
VTPRNSLIIGPDDRSSSRYLAQAEKGTRSVRQPRSGKGGKRKRLSEPVEFMRLVWAVDHALQTTSKRMSRSLGVTGPQRLVVRIVGRVPKVSPGELADILCVHPSTLTGVLRRLIERRLIASRQDPGDRRRALLSLTEKGRELDRHSEGTAEAGVRRTLAGLSGREIQATARFLRKLAAALTEDA